MMMIISKTVCKKHPLLPLRSRREIGIIGGTGSGEKSPPSHGNHSQQSPREVYMNREEMCSAVLAAIKKIDKPRILVAIDGRCGSGKTTLAAALQEMLQCPVVHMDDFFLRPQQRTEERLATPGGNIDIERFTREVLAPLQAGEAFSYRPFRCRTQTLGEPVYVPCSAVTLVEGSYACHRRLWDAYDLRVFLTVSPARQLERLQRRDPDKLSLFVSRWIPMEEQYFAAFDVEGRCWPVLDTTD